ncbi:MAG: TVP38/TMEM64 family protein [Clostridia bacterium]|nr:TVP38/TMEM64 family protein [Clostridia bacterium]
MKNIFDNNTLHGKIMRLVLALMIFLCFVGITFCILVATGAWEKINSVEKIRSVVEAGGIFSFLIFIVFQILQTTILQMPAIIVTLVGVLVFGQWKAFVLSYIAVLIGSIIMFWIGRKCGRGFLHWLCGKQTAEKWINTMSNGKYLFFLMMLFPIFPDDILCVVAGVTNMSFPFFIWTNIIARGIAIACIVFFGSGSIIPYHGWGWLAWAVIFGVMALLFYLSVKFKDKIDLAIKNFAKKKQK